MTHAELTGGFDAVAKALGFRAAGKVQSISIRWNAWALLRIGALIAIAGLFLAVGRHRTAQAPLVVTHTVSLAEFGLQVILPSQCNVKHSAQGFEAANPETGALLVGAVTVSDPPVPNLETMVDRIIERQRAQSGTVENISRGVMAIGLLDARWVKYSFPRDGEMVRARTIAVQRGPKTLTLTCTGGPPAQKGCDAIVHSVPMAR